MIDMAAVETESVDAIFSSHNLEHLYPHEVPRALSEFFRVLRSDGFVVLTCPDLKAVAALVADDKLTEPAYKFACWSYFSTRYNLWSPPSLAKGNIFMAHHCGFTQKVLVGSFRAAGFQIVISRARPTRFDLWVLASKSARAEVDECVHWLNCIFLADHRGQSNLDEYLI